MKSALGAVLCASGLVVTGTPIAAHAQAQTAYCRVATAKPYVAADGKIRAAGSRAGCGSPATFRVRVWRSLPGPDRVVKSGAKHLRNGRVTLSLPCLTGTFYTTVTDYLGHTSRSRPVQVSCDPAGTAGRPPATTPSPTAPSSPAASPTVGTELENEVVRLTNIERAKVGCAPLKHDARLHAAAYGHSADMSAKNYFDHTSPDGRSFVQRITAAGYSYTMAAENIAKGYRTAAAVVQGWMNSPGHRANMLNCAYTDIGVGHVSAGGPYWTQDFGRP